MTDESVLVVGLDAACFERLDPLLDEGVLPNLAGILESGVGSSLETTTPPWTPSAWPSVVTGSRPWTHGVYDFYHYGGEDPRHVSARDVRVPFVWEILAACGHASIVVNVPVTHPPHAIEGSLVPGYIAPGATDCVVDGERTPLDRLDESYHIYPRGDTSKSARLDEYCALIDSRADVATQLADRHPWSFMMVQFQSTDAVFHSMGDGDDAIRRVFERVDDAIGRLLAVAGPDAHVFVVSDHGMHRYEHVFHCNSWLRDRGYLQTSVESTRRSWNEQTLGELSGDDDGGRVPAMVFDGLSRIGLTPSRIERALSVVGLDEFVARRLPESLLIDLVDASEHVDWTDSRAYCRSTASLGIRCNVVGRDPDGVVPRTEFDALRATIVEELSDLTGPEGRPVFDRVYDRHRVHGSDVANEHSAPDIVLRPRDMVWEVSDVVRERTVAETSVFNHNYHGLFVADGARIAENPSIDPTVVDLVPTILALFGVETLDTMDGRVPSALLSDRPPIRQSPSVGEREFLGEGDADRVSETVQDQLREMGYIQ